MSEPWPHPEHTSEDRARFIARLYRHALGGENREARDAVDAWVRQFGPSFGWALDGPLEPSGDVMTRADVAEYAGVAPGTVQKWVERGWLHRLDGGGYSAIEVREHVARIRPSGRRSAVNAHQLDL